MHSTSTRIRVPFHDIDSMRVAWHGHTLKYFEVARCEFLESLGFSYQDMAESGYIWPVVDLRVKYVRPMHFGQDIQVLCSLREWEYRLRIDYEITDAKTQERLVKGYTIQVAVDGESGKMCLESPPVLRERLLASLGSLPE